MIENGTATEHQAEMERRDLFSDLPPEIIANERAYRWIAFFICQLIKMQLIRNVTRLFGFWPGYIFGCAVWIYSMWVGY